MNSEEDILQAKCTQWFHNTYHQYRGEMFAIPNGGKRDKYTANLLKATGVRRGAADIFWLRPGTVIFIETKIPRPGSILSDDQKAFAKKCAEFGLNYFVYRTFEEFKDLINTIIANTAKMY